jgi:hypothetical protein
MDSIDPFEIRDIFESDGSDEHNDQDKYDDDNE